MLRNAEGEGDTDANQVLKEAYLPRTTPGTADAHAAESGAPVATSPLALTQARVCTSANLELCQEQHNPIRHHPSRTPATMVQSSPHN